MTGKQTLISFHAGANDCLRPNYNPELAKQRYHDGVAELAATGATIMLFTVLDRVDAKGIASEWTPWVMLPALVNPTGNGQVYTSVQWAYELSATATWSNFDSPTSPVGTSVSGQFSSSSNATISDPTNGTPIFVRVKIANNMFETLNDQNIVVKVDGYLPGGLSDIYGTNTGGFDPCTQATAFYKEASFLVKARPTINAVTGTFIQQLNP